jgi:hypothetical protein
MEGVTIDIPDAALKAAVDGQTQTDAAEEAPAQ